MASLSDSLTNDFSVELNLIGRHLDPERVTSILGMRPLKAACAGAACACAPEKTYSEGFWVYEVTSHDEINDCRDHHLNRLADALLPHYTRLQAVGVERISFNYTMSSSIGLLNIKFNAATMAKLAQLHADLYVACYDCFNPGHPFMNLKDADVDAATRRDKP